MEVVDEFGLDARGRERVRTVRPDDEEKQVVQSDAHRADITKILARYRQVGIVDHLNTAEAMFRDITEFQDFGDAMLMAKEAEKEFMKLPSKIREVFDHDVATWLDAAHDQEKRDALVEAGIIEAGAEPVAEVRPEAVVAAGGEAAGAAEEVT